MPARKHIGLQALIFRLGGSAGITTSGHAYHFAGRRGVALPGIPVLAIPFATGFAEMRGNKML